MAAAGQEREASDFPASQGQVVDRRVGGVKRGRQNEHPSRSVHSAAGLMKEQEIPNNGFRMIDRWKGTHLCVLN